MEDVSGVTKFSVANNGTTYINATLNAKVIFVKTDVWSDFVFESDYKLMSLRELENFINENNHLPNVPSENEVTENGFSLGDMDALLLQKIEELTLYIIEQQKLIDKMKSQIDDVSNRIE
ncbi:MAG: hypothetical protein A2236_12070 [Bacteroidetes bacterium RIFOXYA2_FULL_33_7]|nr:MAG: hypothetical protein A2236_12070 [Bacteroidetes bacterium RIFOXYA2_FULL_33_7]